MKRETYKKMTETIRASSALFGCVTCSDKILTKISYIIYPVFLIYIITKGEPETAKAVLVPAISFVILSIFRYLYCAPRPYEVFGLPPVLDKNTKGKSFPSRHVFSAFVIAFTIFHFYPVFGIVLGILGVIMAAVRVLGGVHFTKDVIAGALVGIASGVIGFYII